VIPENEPGNGSSLVDPFLTPPATTPTTINPPAGVALFRDAANRAAVPSSPTRESTHQGHDPEVQDWFSDLEAADALLAARMHSHANAGPSTVPTVLSSGPRHSRPGRISPTRKASVRSKAASLVGTHDEDGRTASNISESNRSIVSITNTLPSMIASRSASTRSRAVASPSPTHGMSADMADGGRPITSGGSSSSSANTFSTAKSSFPALQAEGPSLLLGKGKEREGSPTFRTGRSRSNTAGTLPLESESSETIVLPGSPSKSKPRVASGLWGNLRRVFSASGVSPPSSSRGGSPVQRKSRGPDALTPGSAAGTDYESPLSGLSALAGGRLQRRRQQGREAWLTAGEGDGGDEKGHGRQAHHHNGVDTDAIDDDEDDWDIERAVEQRLVQVMFTVPKERLRVVNADAESLRRGSGQTATPPDEKEVKFGRAEGADVAPLVVRKIDSRAGLKSGEKRDSGMQEQQRQEVVEEKDEKPDSPINDDEELHDVLGDEKSQLFDDEEETALGTDLGHDRYHDEAEHDPEEPKGLTPPPAAHLQESEHEDQGEMDAHNATGGGEKGSPFKLADDLRLDRPRKRVLEMVEDIEGRSRSESPETPLRRRTGVF
jgi:hypothetical protein